MSSDPSVYPAELDTLKADNEARLLQFEGTPDPSSEFGEGQIGHHAGLHNAVANAIMAIEKELGIEPSGEAATVAARMKVIETKLGEEEGSLVSQIKAIEEALKLVEASGVVTFNGRAGAVAPVTNDYSLEQIQGLAAALNTLTEGIEAKSSKGELKTEKERAETSEASRLSKAGNLGDVASAATSRANLGLGTSATKDAGGAGEVGKVLRADDWVAVEKLIKAHGEVEGKQAPDLSLGGVHTYTAKGAFTLKAPVGAVVTEEELAVTVVVKQDAAGARVITTEGITWISGEPVFNTLANATNVIPLVSWDGGLTWFAFGPEKGATGAKGSTGAEGFYPGKLLLPSEVKSWKKPSANETENRAASAASHNDRTLPSATLTLTSGTPVVSAIPTPAKTVINGIGFALNALENTPANRTHLWVAVVNSAGKVLALGKDYTSSANVALTAAKLNALLFEAPIESGAEPEVLYAVLCEVMSSTNPITVLMRESSTPLTGAKPIMAATLPAGQTTPPVVGTTLAFTEAAKEPYMCFV